MAAKAPCVEYANHEIPVASAPPACKGKDAPKPPPRLAFAIDEARYVSNTSRTALYSAIRVGELVARKCGRRTIILARDLEDWLNKLPKVV